MLARAYEDGEAGGHVRSSGGPQEYLLMDSAYSSRLKRSTELPISAPVPHGFGGLHTLQGDLPRATASCTVTSSPCSA